MGNKASLSKGRTASKRAQKLERSRVKEERENVRKNLTVSMSNLSTNLSEEQELAKDDKLRLATMKFSYRNLSTIYDKYRSEHSLNTGDMPNSVLKLMSFVFEAINSDDYFVLYRRKYKEVLFHMDIQYITLFQTLVEMRDTQLKRQCRTMSMECQLLEHSMYLLRMHRHAVVMLEEGKPEKAFEVYTLVALSHTLMKVKPPDFDQAAVRLLELMNLMNLITDEQLEPVTYFIVTVTKFISDRMERFLEISKDHVPPTPKDTLAREYYRELKKWEHLKNLIAKSMHRYLAILESKERLQSDSTTMQEDRETWRINRLLRRGCKYYTSRHDDLESIHKKL